MSQSATRLSTLSYLVTLESELKALPVRANPFCQAFQRSVTQEQLRRFIRYRYAIGIKFRKMVIGLLYNLSDQDEPISLELMRVLHSEYGQGIHRTVLGPVSNPTES
jgi:hypothetical protein